MRDFESGDIIVPRKDLREWTSSAVVVDEVLGDGTVYAYRFGYAGGRLRFDPMAVEKFDFVKVPKDKLDNPGWKSIQVFAEWTEKNYQAWTTGQHWNGWEMPYFEFDEAMRYIRDVDNTVYDSTRDVFITTLQGDPEPEITEATIIKVRGRGDLKVYPIGAGNWTWSQAPEEKEEDDEPTMGIMDPHSQFSSPQFAITASAKQAFEESGEQPAKYLDRHFSGDFGEVTGDDAAMNQANMATNNMVMSIYTLSTGVRFYIITDEGHGMTTLLLPEEY